MAAGALSAQTIARAASFDPQLRVPVRPRLRRGLVVQTQDEQVVVTGTPTRQLFRGSSATTVLPKLLDALDGHRGHRELGHVIGASETTVFAALSLLWACGVVEEAAPAAGPPPGVSDDLADLLSRLGDSTGANEAWEQSAARLAAAVVEVVGDDAAASALTDELESPLTVRRVGRGAPTPEATLVVLVQRGSLDPASLEVADRCWSRGTALLRVHLCGQTIELGPYVQRGTTSCLRCLTVGDRADADLADGAVSAFGDHADLGLGAGLASREVFALISRSVPVSLPTRWRRIDLTTLAATEMSAATRSGCPVCSCGPARPLAPAPLAARFEASVAIPPRAFADLKAHQAHYKPSNLALQRGFRSWPLSQRHSLPVPALERLSVPPSPPRRGVTVDELSLVLATSAGVKRVGAERVDRWTAAGGNIGSVTAYVAVRDCRDLAPGLYAYVAADHQLAGLGPCDGALADGAPATVVLTGDYRKVARKYAAFALRIVLLDSGCAQSTARRVARWLGLAMHVREQWDDAGLAAALAIDPDLEPITSVLDLGERA